MNEVYYFFNPRHKANGQFDFKHGGAEPEQEQEVEKVNKPKRGKSKIKKQLRRAALKSKALKALGVLGVAGAGALLYNKLKGKGAPAGKIITSDADLPPEAPMPSSLPFDPSLPSAPSTPLSTVQDRKPKRVVNRTPPGIMKDPPVKPVEEVRAQDWDRLSARRKTELQTLEYNSRKWVAKSVSDRFGVAVQRIDDKTDSIEVFTMKYDQPGVASMFLGSTKVADMRYNHEMHLRNQVFETLGRFTSSPLDPDKFGHSLEKAIPLARARVQTDPKNQLADRPASFRNRHEAGYVNPLDLVKPGKIETGQIGSGSELSNIEVGHRRGQSPLERHLKRYTPDSPAYGKEQLAFDLYRLQDARGRIIVNGKKVNFLFAPPPSFPPKPVEPGLDIPWMGDSNGSFSHIPTRRVLGIKLEDATPEEIKAYTESKEQLDKSIKHDWDEGDQEAPKSRKEILNERIAAAEEHRKLGSNYKAAAADIAKETGLPVTEHDHKVTIGPVTADWTYATEQAAVKIDNIHIADKMVYKVGNIVVGESRYNPDKDIEEIKQEATAAIGNVTKHVKSAAEGSRDITASYSALVTTLPKSQQRTGWVPIKSLVEAAVLKGQRGSGPPEHRKAGFLLTFNNLREAMQQPINGVSLEIRKGSEASSVDSIAIPSLDSPGDVEALYTFRFVVTEGRKKRVATAEEVRGVVKQLKEREEKAKEEKEKEAKRARRRALRAAKKQKEPPPTALSGVDSSILLSEEQALIQLVDYHNNTPSLLGKGRKVYIDYQGSSVTLAEWRRLRGLAAKTEHRIAFMED